MDLTSNISDQMGYAWFPIQDDGGKEQYKFQCIELEVQNFSNIPDQFDKSESV